jgi:predicted Zn-ribbon and HTH transcriptional regulator
MQMKTVHNSLVEMVKSFDRSGPPLFYGNCTKCKYDFIGTKKQTRCASCRAINRRI